MDNQKNSSNAPDWFHVMPEWKIKQFKDYIAKNEDTINIFNIVIKYCNELCGQCWFCLFGGFLVRLYIYSTCFHSLLRLHV